MYHVIFFLSFFLRKNMNNRRHLQFHSSALQFRYLRCTCFWKQPWRIMFNSELKNSIIDSYQDLFSFPNDFNSNVIKNAVPLTWTKITDWSPMGKFLWTLRRNKSTLGPKLQKISEIYQIYSPFPGRKVNLFPEPMQLGATG